MASHQAFLPTGCKYQGIKQDCRTYFWCSVIFDFLRPSLPQRSSARDELCDVGGAYGNKPDTFIDDHSVESNCMRDSPHKDKAKEPGFILRILVEVTF